MVSRRTYHSVRAAGLSPAEGVSAAALKTLLTIPTAGIILPLFSATDITRGRCFLKPRAITLLYGWLQSCVAGHPCAQPDENAAPATPGTPCPRQAITQPSLSRCGLHGLRGRRPVCADRLIQFAIFHLNLRLAREPAPHCGCIGRGFAGRVATAPRR